MKWFSITALCLPCLVIPQIVFTGHHETDPSDLERAGTCSDAQLQVEYFCNKKNSANDTMVQVGTACRNAKVNFKAACDGIVDADAEYRFDN